MIVLLPLDTVKVSPTTQPKLMVQPYGGPLN